MPSYKWDSPFDWLDEKISSLRDSGNIQELYSITNVLLTCLDSDQVQDIFQSEMEEDGYFEDLDAKDAFRDRIYSWIESQTNFLQISSREYAGPKMTREDYLRVKFSTSVDQLYLDHGGDIEEAIAELS